MAASVTSAVSARALPSAARDASEGKCGEGGEGGGSAGRGLMAKLTRDLAQLQFDASASAGAPSLRFDPVRGIVMRVLSGKDEGREYVLPRNAIALLPGAGNAATPDALTLGTTPEGDTAVVIRWHGGGESLLPCEELKRLALAHGAQ